MSIPTIWIVGPTELTWTQSHGCIARIQNRDLVAIGWSLYHASRKPQYVWQRFKSRVMSMKNLKLQAQCKGWVGNGSYLYSDLLVPRSGLKAVKEAAGKMRSWTCLQVTVTTPHTEEQRAAGERQDLERRHIMSNTLKVRHPKGNEPAKLISNFSKIWRGPTTSGLNPVETQTWTIYPRPFVSRVHLYNVWEEILHCMGRSYLRGEEIASLVCDLWLFCTLLSPAFSTQVLGSG